MNALRRLAFVALLFGGGGHAPALRQSTVTVHLHGKGLFGSLAPDYAMYAPIATGSIDLEQPEVDIVVHPGDLTVADQSVSDTTRHEIETAMRGPEVLDVEKYPEARFRGREVTAISSEHYRVAGTLEMHGVSRQVAIDFAGTPTHYHGRAHVNQSDFGIRPRSFAGGLVSLEDEIEIEFDLFAQPVGTK